MFKAIALSISMPFFVGGMYLAWGITSDQAAGFALMIVGLVMARES